MNSQRNRFKYTFIETGWFTAIAFVVGAIFGFIVGTNFLSNVDGDMNVAQIIIAMITTVSGSIGGVLLAVNLRKIL